MEPILLILFSCPAVSSDGEGSLEVIPHDSLVREDLPKCPVGPVLLPTLLKTTDFNHQYLSLFKKLENIVTMENITTETVA